MNYICEARINKSRIVDDNLISNIRTLSPTCNKESFPTLFDVIQRFLCTYDDQYSLDCNNLPIDKINVALLNQQDLDALETNLKRQTLSYSLIRAARILHSLQRSSESSQERSTIHRLQQCLENIMQNYFRNNSNESSFEEYLNDLSEHKIDYKVIATKSTIPSNTEVQKILNEITSNISKLKSMMSTNQNSSQYNNEINTLIRLLENLKH